MKPILTAAALVAAAIAPILPPASAEAQMSNRPYAFPGGSGGPSMSLAGRQAIVLNEIDSSFTPRFLLRAPVGGLLTVVPNPAGSDVPLVFGPDGVLLPGFRGQRRLAGDLVPFGAGVFNAFFADRSGSALGVGFGGPDSISVWTARAAGLPVGYGPADPIDAWTGAVYGLGNSH